jgi:hypothetical protein
VEYTPVYESYRRNILDRAQRKAVFLALVAAQDSGMPPGKSRTVVADQFGISGAAVRMIEEEGIAAEWPPL